MEEGLRWKAGRRFFLSLFVSVDNATPKMQEAAHNLYSFFPCLLLFLQALAIFRAIVVWRTLAHTGLAAIVMEIVKYMFFNVNLPVKKSSFDLTGACRCITME